MIFSCSLRSKFFIQIFVQKMADFTILGSTKKNWANGEKAVGRARKTGFSFSWPNRPIFSQVFLEISYYVLNKLTFFPSTPACWVMCKTIICNSQSKKWKHMIIYLQCKSVTYIWGRATPILVIFHQTAWAPQRTPSQISWACHKLQFLWQTQDRNRKQFILFM